MKILFLDQYSEPGGAQACLLDLLPAINARGWTAHAALPRPGPLADKLRSAGVEVHELPCGRYRSGRKAAADVLRFPFDVARQAGVLRRLLAETDFDVIYVNGARVLPAAAIAAKGRVPLVFHAHWRYRGAAALAVRWALRRSAATVIAYCRYVTPPLRVPAHRLHVISNGVVDCGFREGSFDPTAGLRIGIIGRIAPEKGQAEFVEAASLLAPEFPSARFVICGAPLFADPRYEVHVRHLARGLPVDFLGWQDNIAGVLRNLGLLVVASTREGPPRALLEAFSAGVPVVAFRAGGIPEALEDERTGFLVPESSAAALAARIRALIAGDPTRLREAAHNARRAWERSHNLALFQNRITSLLADLPAASPAEAPAAAPPPRTPAPPSTAPERTPAGK